MFLEEMKNEPTQDVLVALRKQSETLRQLEFEMMAAEDAYKQAQARYTEFATKVLPEMYLSAGVDSLTTSDGKMIRIVTKTSASIKKGTDNGKTSKQLIAKWLREHNGEALIKNEFIVPASQKELLVKYGIINEEIVDVNTNALKKFLTDALGQGGSPATITQDELPSNTALSFYQWNQAEVS